MRLFFRLVQLAVTQQITYRTALIAGLATNLFFGFMRVAVMLALYRGQTLVNGVSLEAAVTFVAVSQASIAFLSLFGSYEVMATVYDGSIAVDLLKPVGLFAYWMAKDLGRSLVNLLARGVLLVALFSLFYPLTMPVGIAQWAGLLAALTLGWLVSFAWRFLVNLASFWTPDARGIGRAAFTASQLFSGFFMPLKLYPDWFANLCQWTPFPAMFNTAVEAYLGLLPAAEMGRALAMQAAWFVGLTLLAALVLRAGLRKLVLQGG